MAEMRLTMAYILRHFDLEPDWPADDVWTEQKSYMLWVKKPLRVKIKQTL